MPLSSDARQWAIQNFFFLNQGVGDIGQWTFHICDGLTTSSDPSVANVTAASKGTATVGDATSGTSSPNRLQDFWEWNSSVDANNDGTTGGVRNKSSIVITATGAGTIDTFAIIMRDADDTDYVWAYGDTGTSVSLASGDGIGFAIGAIEFEIA